MPIPHKFKQKLDIIVTPDLEYNQYLNTLPDNQRFTPNDQYDSYLYWQLNDKPKDFQEAYNRGMFEYNNSDRLYHAGSIAEDSNGNYLFMKPITHPTIQYETDWYNKGLITLEDGTQRHPTPEELIELQNFRLQYKLVNDPNRPNFYMYKRQYDTGGQLNKPLDWNKLSMKEKAAYIRMGVANGYKDVDSIKLVYNEYRNGGYLKANVYGEGGNIDDDLIDWIIKEEGFNKKPEDIGDGKITLGSGLTNPKWHKLYLQRGNKWSAEDNRMAVAEEVANRRRWAEKNIPNWDSLPVSSLKALLSYKYNYNFTPKNSPKLFQALLDSDLYEAARQMDATSKDPKFKKGLTDRRLRELQWFLQDVQPQYVTLTPYVEVTNPTISTKVNNPFVLQVDNTLIAPVMVPDESSYVKTHRLTEEEDNYNKAAKLLENVIRFNRLMEALNIQNNVIPQFIPLFTLPFANTTLSDIINSNNNKKNNTFEDGGYKAPWVLEAEEKERLLKSWLEQQAEKYAQAIEDAKHPTGHYINEIIVTPNEVSLGSVSSDAMLDNLRSTLRESTARLNKQSREMILHIHEGTNEATKWLAPLVMAPALPALTSSFTTSGIASTLAPGSAFWTNPITQQIAASNLGGTAIDATANVVTGKKYGENVSNIVHETTGFNPLNSYLGSLLVEATNPGYYLNSTQTLNTVGRIGDVMKEFIKDAAITAKSYMLHPTYLTVYHGSPHPFSIKEFNRGTSHDIGLHTGPKEMAESAGYGFNDAANTLYKLRIPLADTETIDIGANGVNQLSKDLVWNAHPYIPEYPNVGYSFLSKGNKTLPKWLKEAGVGIKTAPSNRGGYKMWTDTDAHINLRDKAFPNISSEDQVLADLLLNDSKKFEGIFNWDKAPKEASEMAEINTKANDLLARNGYKVIKYYNNNDLEGAGNAFMVTDPSVIDVMPDMSLSKYKSIWNSYQPIFKNSLLLKASPKIAERKAFKSELDWSPEGWFGTRATGSYDAEDIAALLSHLPEYLEIERTAKANGTWLKMPDGSTWKGDPRSWVLMQSKAFKEASLGDEVLYHGNSDRWINDNGVDVTADIIGNKSIWTSTNPNLWGTYGNKKYELVIPNNTPIETVADAEGRYWRDVLAGTNTNDLVYPNLTSDNAIRINNVIDRGPNLFNRTELPAALPRESVMDYNSRVFLGDDVVLGGNIKRKSLLGNNGDFNLANYNIYKGLIPYMIPTGFSLGAYNIKSK